MHETILRKDAPFTVPFTVYRKLDVESSSGACMQPSQKRDRKAGTIPRSPRGLSPLFRQRRVYDVGLTHETIHPLCRSICMSYHSQLTKNESYLYPSPRYTYVYRTRYTPPFIHLSFLPFFSQSPFFFQYFIYLETFRHPFSFYLKALSV